MTEDVAWMLATRLGNAIAWTIVLSRLIRADKPVTGLTRQLICGLILVGFWLLALGTLVQGHLVDPHLVGLIYTGYTAVSAIVGVALLSLRGRI
jgi:hypothetical protein